MKEYRTRGGFVFTDEDIERWGAAAERGEFPGKPGRFIVAPPGRPPLFDEELVNIGFKIPLSWRKRLDEKAAASGTSRSELLREAIRQALA